MKTNARALLAVAICLPMALTGCQTTSGAFSNDCKIAGTGMGALLGGVTAGLLLGEGNGQIVAALAGAAAGAFVGNQIGSMLDCQDQQAAAMATQQAGSGGTGEKTYWSTPTAQAKVVAAQKQDVTRTASTQKTQAKKPNTETADAWTMREPVKSSGDSGMWGWVEPINEPTLQADGRLCRDLRQVAVDQQGQQNAETVKSCQDEQQRWVIATR